MSGRPFFSLSYIGYKINSLKAIITHNDQTFTVDLAKPLDISIPLAADENPLAWYLEKPRFEAVRDGDWIGLVSEGRCKF